MNKKFNTRKEIPLIEIWTNLQKKEELENQCL